MIAPGDYLESVSCLIMENQVTGTHIVSAGDRCGIAWGDQKANLLAFLFVGH
jgi:hypothetical protein